MKLASASFVGSIRAEFASLPVEGPPTAGPIRASFTPAQLSALFTLGVFRLPVPLLDGVVFSDAAQKHFYRAVGPDTFTLSDAALTAFGRGLGDSASVSDALRWHISRAVSGDSVLALDSASFSVDKPTAENVVFPDTTYRTLVRPVPDAVLLSDALAYSLAASRTLADIYALSDNAKLHPEKPRQDTFSVADAIGFQWDWLRAFSSPATFGDAASKNLSRPLSDTTALSDALAYSLVAGRTLADTVSLSIAGEVVYKVFTSKQTDVVSLADTGSVHSQSYADETYFEGDYVGVSRDF